MAEYYTPSPPPLERTELEVNVQICNKTDCPIYSCFFDPMNYKPLKDIYEKKKRNGRTSELYDNVVKTANHIKMNCLSCQYFEKVDMYGMMITAEAKMLLEQK